MERNRDVTDAELAVLERLWQTGEMPVRSLAEDLYCASGPAQLATVQKLLERLESKDCVTKRKQGKAFIYRPAVDRGGLIDVGLAAVAERLCNGSLTPLITHLVAAQKLSKSELDSLKKLIESSARDK